MPLIPPFVFCQEPALDTPLPVMLTDEETTGLNKDESGRSHDRHGIVQIGAVDIPTGQSFYGRCRLREGAEVDPSALAVNGLTMEEITDPSLPTEAELLAEFSSWSRMVAGSDPRLLGGINPRFDLDFLAACMRHANMDLKQTPFARRTISVEELVVAEAYRRSLPIPGKGFDTDKNYIVLGLPVEPRPHNAYVGALYSARAIDELMPSRTPPRKIQPPTLFGVSKAPDCPDPFATPSLRRLYDKANLALLAGDETLANRLAEIEAARGPNPAFSAHLSALKRGIAIIVREDRAPTRDELNLTHAELAQQVSLTERHWRTMEEARPQKATQGVAREATIPRIAPLAPPMSAAALDRPTVKPSGPRAPFQDGP